MPLPNFFKSYFYGSSGKRDFTEADLPENRLQLFRDVLSVRRGSMVGVNFLLLLCWLPAILWTFMNLVQLYQLDAEAASAGGMIANIIYSWLLVLFPLTALTGPCTMGVSYVMRNWARDEHSFVLADFRDAVKGNWKQGLIFGLISGAIPLAGFICCDFYAGLLEASPVFYLPLILTLAAAAVWYLCAMILPTMIVTYRQGFMDLLKNAVLMTLADLPKAILIKLATLAVPILTLAILAVYPAALGWVSAAAVALYAIFLPAFNKLICASWANALCEKYLNTKIEGAQVNIGLRPKEESK